MMSKPTGMEGGKSGLRMAKGGNASVSGDHGDHRCLVQQPSPGPQYPEPSQNVFFYIETCTKSILNIILMPAGVYGYIMVSRCWSQRFHFKKHGGGVHSLRGSFCFVWSAMHSLMVNPPALCTFHREDVKNFFFKKTL